MYVCKSVVIRLVSQSVHEVHGMHGCAPAFWAPQPQHGRLKIQPRTVAFRVAALLSPGEGGGKGGGGGLASPGGMRRCGGFVQGTGDGTQDTHGGDSAVWVLLYWLFVMVTCNLMRGLSYLVTGAGM